MRRARSLAPAVAALLVLCADASAQSTRALRFCVADYNLPLSRGSPVEGIEIDVARALAERVGARAEFVWRNQFEEGLPQGVAEGACDVAVGTVAVGTVAEATGMAEDPLVPGLALTVPYYAAGYLLLQRADAPPARALAEVGEERIATEAESIPTYTLKQRGRRVALFKDYDAVVEALADGRARYGYLWGPLAVRLLRHRSDVVLAEGFEPEERWDFALAVREEETELRAGLDAAIGDLVRSGQIERIFVRHGVPYLPPGAESSDASDRAGPDDHAGGASAGVPPRTP